MNDEYQCNECNHKFVRDEDDYEISCPKCNSTELYPLEFFAEKTNEKVTEEKILVFVYGTLMRGHGLNDYIKDFPYKSATLKDYRRIWPRDNFPVIVKEEGETVRGEIYSIDQGTLEQLDSVEGVPTLYTREQVEVTDDFFGLPIKNVNVYIPSPRIEQTWRKQEDQEMIYNDREA